MIKQIQRYIQLIPFVDPLLEGSISVVSLLLRGPRDNVDGTAHGSYSTGLSGSSRSQWQMPWSPSSRKTVPQKPHVSNGVAKGGIMGPCSPHPPLISE